MVSPACLSRAGTPPSSRKPSQAAVFTPQATAGAVASGVPAWSVTLAAVWAEDGRVAWRIRLTRSAPPRSSQGAREIADGLRTGSRRGSGEGNVSIKNSGCFWYGLGGIDGQRKKTLGGRWPTDGTVGGGSRIEASSGWWQPLKCSHFRAASRLSADTLSFNTDRRYIPVVGHGFAGPNFRAVATAKARDERAAAQGATHQHRCPCSLRKLAGGDLPRTSHAPDWLSIDATATKVPIELPPENPAILSWQAG